MTAPIREAEMIRATLLLLAGSAAGFAPAQPPAEKKPAEKKTYDLSPVVAASTVKTADIPFGKDPLQRLDVYAPRGANGAPVVLFVHGGEWTKRDKAEVSYKPKFLNESGLVFVSTNYRLSPAATHPAHAADVAAAARWVRDHVAEYGGDPGRVVLMGHSAGCHLVTLVGLDPQYLAAEGLKPADLRGVVAWSGGAYDLPAKVAEGGSYAGYIKAAFGPDEAGWKAASPVTHAGNAAGGPPFLFISVEKGNASHRAAERLAGLIREAKGAAEVKLLEGRDHTTANHLLGAPDDTTGRILLDFVRAAK